MTDRKQALIALRDKVKVGETPRAHEIFTAFPTVLSADRLISWIMNPSDIRAMGAAKALHEAVLPDWAWTIQDDCEQTVWPPNELADEEWCAEGITAVYPLEDNPALAWFLAILEVLIAQESGQ